MTVAPFVIERSSFLTTNYFQQILNVLAVKSLKFKINSKIIHCITHVICLKLTYYACFMNLESLSSQFFIFCVFRLYYKQYLFHIIKQTENRQIFASLIFAHFHF